MPIEKPLLAWFATNLALAMVVWLLGFEPDTYIPPPASCATLPCISES